MPYFEPDHKAVIDSEYNQIQRINQHISWAGIYCVETRAAGDIHRHIHTHIRTPNTSTSENGKRANKNRWPVDTWVPSAPRNRCHIRMLFSICPCALSSWGRFSPILLHPIAHSLFADRQEAPPEYTEDPSFSSTKFLLSILVLLILLYSSFSALFSTLCSVFLYSSVASDFHTLCYYLPRIF